jgi:uncharacterized membrane protein
VRSFFKALELSRFLLVRGLWLILVDLTLIKFGWRLEVDLHRPTAGVIFVIGASMVALAALIWLPRWAIASVTLIMLVGHNLLDGFTADELGGASWAWRVLHGPGLVPMGAGANLYVLYPLIPWIGVMGATRQNALSLGPQQSRSITKDLQQKTSRQLIG